MKDRNKFIPGIIVALLVCLLASGCSGLSKVKDIKVTSCGLESYSLKGLRSVNAVLAIGIDNPTFAFKVMDVNGTVKYNGDDIATYSVDSVSVDRKCSKVYELPCAAALSERVSLIQLAQMLKKGDFSGFTADVNATVRLGKGKRKGQTIRLKDIKLEEILK